MHSSVYCRQPWGVVAQWLERASSDRRQRFEAITEKLLCHHVSASEHNRNNNWGSARHAVAHLWCCVLGQALATSREWRMRIIVVNVVVK